MLPTSGLAQWLFWFLCCLLQVMSILSVNTYMAGRELWCCAAWTPGCWLVCAEATWYEDLLESLMADALAVRDTRKV